MLTASQFISAWRRRHHPSADVGADAAFYYGLYGRLHAVAERCAHGFSEAHLLSLLLYAENTVAVGLDGVYEYMYRSLGDVVARWCGALGMAGAAGQVGSLITEAVAAAPCSSLRRWMAASALSSGFRPLGGMLTWLARDDKALRRVFPCLRYRKAMFMRLAGDRRAAQRMLWADMAFNWRDKRGLSLPQALARQLSHAAASADEGEGRPLRQAAVILSGISSERLDTYTMVGRGGDGALTLRRADGRLFGAVASAGPLAGAAPGSLVAAQLVTVRGTTYVSGPARLLSGGDAARWHGPALWPAIEQAERAHAMRTTITTPYGKPLSLYDDLYGDHYALPAGPAEASLACLGLHPGEPTMLDFLNLVKPAG